VQNVGEVAGIAVFILSLENSYGLSTAFHDLAVKPGRVVPGADMQAVHPTAGKGPDAVNHTGPVFHEKGAWHDVPGLPLFHIPVQRLFNLGLPGAGHTGNRIPYDQAFQSGDVDTPGNCTAEGATFSAGRLAAVIGSFRLKRRVNFV